MGQQMRKATEERDELGNRMKLLEASTSLLKLDPSLPIMCRLDGRAFSSFTSGMQRPFDPKMMELMQKTTLHMVKETNAVLGYTQSDEISLVILTSPESEPYFGARLLKMCSVLPSVCSVYFNSELPNYFPEKKHKYPVFDCRVWNVPSLEMAGQTILWRELDCTKNAIQIAARSMFSHKSLDGLTGREMIRKMREEKGIDFETKYPLEFQRGSFFQKRIVEKPFSLEEIDTLPLMHEARKNLGLIIKRNIIEKVTLSPLKTIKNLPEILFKL